MNVAHSEEGTWALEWHQVQHTGGDWQYQPQPGNASHLQHLRASCFSLASYFYYKVQPSPLSIFIGRNFRWIMGLTRTKNTGKHLPNIKGLPCWHSGVLPNYINLQFYISESISEHNRKWSSKPKTFMLLGFLWSFHFLTCQIKAPQDVLESVESSRQDNFGPWFDSITRVTLIFRPLPAHCTFIGWIFNKVFKKVFYKFFNNVFKKVFKKVSINVPDIHHDPLGRRVLWCGLCWATAPMHCNAQLGRKAPNVRKSTTQAMIRPWVG